MLFPPPPLCTMWEETESRLLFPVPLEEEEWATETEAAAGA